MTQQRVDAAPRWPIRVAAGASSRAPDLNPYVAHATPGTPPATRNSRLP